MNESAVYYLSKRFHDYETRYTPIEKSCFSLLWAVQKLRHIIIPFQIWVVARMNPLKYLFEKPALSGRLSIKVVDSISRIRSKVYGKKNYQREYRIKFLYKEPRGRRGC